MFLCLCKTEDEHKEENEEEEEKKRRKGRRRKYAEGFAEFAVVVITENRHESLLDDTLHRAPSESEGDTELSQLTEKDFDSCCYD